MTPSAAREELARLTKASVLITHRCWRHFPGQSFQFDTDKFEINIIGANENEGGYYAADDGTLEGAVALVRAAYAMPASSGLSEASVLTNEVWDRR